MTGSAGMLWWWVLTAAEKTAWWKSRLPEGARGLAVGYVLVTLVLALIAISFDLFVIGPVLEGVYGGEALRHQPLDWLSDGAWWPIAEALALLIPSMPLWREHHEERRRALMFLSTSLLFYLLWGFVLRALSGWEKPLRITGEAGIFFTFFLNVAVAAQIRMRAIREDDDK